MSNGTNAANLFEPDFMPEQTISTTVAGGITGWVKSVPLCMAFEDSDAIRMALEALGYLYTKTFSYPPYTPGYGQTFSGGLENGNVPWLVLSPVPVINNNWDATAGAFAVNAGKFANYWNHGVSPFVGSSYEAELRADIAMRIEAAKNGNPNLG